MSFILLFIIIFTLSILICCNYFLKSRYLDFKMIFLYFPYGKIDKMVYLPSEVIENIISFLGGEKFNIDIKDSITKILKQKDIRLREMMIKDILLIKTEQQVDFTLDIQLKQLEDLTHVLSKISHAFICKHYEESYVKIKDKKILTIFSLKIYNFNIISNGVTKVLNLYIQPTVMNMLFSCNVNICLNPKYKFMSGANFYKLKFEERDTFIYTDDFLKQIYSQIYEKLID